MAQSDDLLNYYLQELAYLREAGMSYAERYPKIAARLQLEPGESQDPHVERLIESVAFLTARIRQNFDNALPELSGELLDILYPHYQQPIPPMAIAQFRPDPQKGGMTAGQKIARGTRLFTHATSELVCHFRTGYDVELWPIEVTRLDENPPAEWHDATPPADCASSLFLRLEARNSTFEELGLARPGGLRRLRFFLAGSQVTTGQIYELLLAQTIELHVRGPGGQARLGPEALEEVGFLRQEALLPGLPEAHPAYRLLTEYSVFPAKFRFVDLCFPRHLPASLGGGQVLDVGFFFNRRVQRKSWLELSPDTFALGATPAINLFPRTSEPLRFDHTRSEFRLVADRRRERYTEIQSVDSVSASADPKERDGRVSPYYSFAHRLTERPGAKAYWHMRRVPTHLKDAVGTDVLLSFHDLDFTDQRPSEDVLYAHILCNNRNLAEQLRTYSELQSDQTDVLAVLLEPPTPHIQPTLGGEARWRLISHLSLNYLSLTEGERSLGLLKEMLELYNPLGRSNVLRQIRSMVSLRTSPALRRMRSQETWRGFVRGTEIDLVLDDDIDTSQTGGSLLFATVLERFFALYAPADRFTQLVVRKKSEQQEEWARWPPRIGERVLP